MYRHDLEKTLSIAIIQNTLYFVIMAVYTVYLNCVLWSFFIHYARIDTGIHGHAIHTSQSAIFVLQHAEVLIKLHKVMTHVQIPM